MQRLSVCQFEFVVLAVLQQRGREQQQLNNIQGRFKMYFLDFCLFVCLF